MQKIPIKKPKVLQVNDRVVMGICFAKECGPALFRKPYRIAI